MITFTVETNDGKLINEQIDPLTGEKTTTVTESVNTTQRWEVEKADRAGNVIESKTIEYHSNGYDKKLITTYDNGEIETLVYDPQQETWSREQAEE